MSIRLAPSLLSADFAHLADEVAEVERGGADLLHLDIMDGHFVPNLTFGPLVVRAIASRSKIALDAHLMVTDPDDLIDDLIAAPVARIAVHIEVCSHLQRTLESIRTGGVEAGIAVNPASAISLLEDALPWTDFVLIMSVNPGSNGCRKAVGHRCRRRRLSRECGIAGRRRHDNPDRGVSHLRSRRQGLRDFRFTSGRDLWR